MRVRPQQLGLRLVSSRAHECIGDVRKGAWWAPMLAGCVTSIIDMDSEVQLSTGAPNEATVQIQYRVSVLSDCEGWVRGGSTERRAKANSLDKVCVAGRLRLGLELCLEIGSDGNG